MSSTNVNDNSSTEKIVLRDLQSLLRKTIKDDRVRVVDYTTSSLLPKGENYGSLMLKVDAVIERSSAKEKLPLVAKMCPATEFQQNIIDLTASFKKEIFVFEKLIKAYRCLEEEANVDKVLDLLPKFYGGRLSLKNDDDVGADKDAVLLMENLKERGYFTMNRIQGFY